MEPDEDPEALQRRVLARRSTLAGLGGIVLVALAVVLTLAHVLGNVVPTVLSIVGVGSLIAGVSTGAMQIVDHYRRPGPEG